MSRKSGFRKWGLLCLAGITAFSIAACGGISGSDHKLIVVEEETNREVSLFSPMEKTEANVENVARSAADKTIMLAEEKMGVSVGYVTYTAEIGRAHV